jgi:hypothetical protein
MGKYLTYGEIFDARRPIRFATSEAERAEPRCMPARGAAGFGDRSDGVLIRRHGLHLDAPLADHECR